MKRFIGPACICAMILFYAAGMAEAQTTVQLELVNANYFNPPITDNGVYAGPYTGGIVNGNGSVSPTFAIICDNYDTDVSTGLQWLAAGVTLSQEFNANVPPPLKLENSLSSGLSAYNNGNPVTAELAYEAAAWMAQQIMQIGSGSPNSLSAMQQQAIADYNWAIWALFSNNAVANAGGFDPGAQQDLKTALGNSYTLSQFDNVTFWVPYNSVPPNSNCSLGSPCYGVSQEYITVTPEPKSMLLFGTGLLAIAFVLRRRHLRNA